MLVQDAPDRARLGHHLVPPAAICIEDARENAAKARPAVLVIRRKVGSAEEDLSRGGSGRQ